MNQYHILTLSLFVSLALNAMQEEVQTKAMVPSEISIYACVAFYTKSEWPLERQEVYEKFHRQPATPDKFSMSILSLIKDGYALAQTLYIGDCASGKYDHLKGFCFNTTDRQVDLSLKGIILDGMQTSVIIKCVTTTKNDPSQKDIREVEIPFDRKFSKTYELGFNDETGKNVTLTVHTNK